MPDAKVAVSFSGLWVFTWLEYGVSWPLETATEPGRGFFSGVGAGTQRTRCFLSS